MITDIKKLIDLYGKIDNDEWSELAYICLLTIYYGTRTHDIDILERWFKSSKHARNEFIKRIMGDSHA